MSLPDPAASESRTFLAWQRTALSIVVAGAIIARVTFARLDWFALAAVALVVPMSVLLLAGARGRRTAHAPERVAHGPALAAVALAVAGLVLVELVAIAATVSGS